MVLKVWVIIRRQGTLGDGAVASPLCSHVTVLTEQARALESSAADLIPPSCSEKKRSTDQLIFILD